MVGTLLLKNYIVGINILNLRVCWWKLFFYLTLNQHTFCTNNLHQNKKYRLSVSFVIICNYLPEPWRYFRNEIWFQARPSKTWITFAYQIIKIYVSVLCVYIFIICSQTWWVNFDLMSGFFWWDSILKISISRNRNSVAFSNAIKILLRIVHFSDMKLKYLKEFPLNNFLNSLKYNSYLIILRFKRSANSLASINWVQRRKILSRLAF